MIGRIFDQEIVPVIQLPALVEIAFNTINRNEIIINKMLQKISEVEAEFSQKYRREQLLKIDETLKNLLQINAVLFLYIKERGF